MTNDELQKELHKYPGDLPVAIAIQYNESLSLFYAVKVKGMKSGDLKVVILHNDDVDLEYETLLNGAEINEEIYS